MKEETFKGTYSELGVNAYYRTPQRMTHPHFPGSTKYSTVCLDGLILSSRS
jgi:hypothetical protein